MCFIAALPVSAAEEDAGDDSEDATANAWAGSVIFFFAFKMLENTVVQWTPLSKLAVFFLRSLNYVIYIIKMNAHKNI